MDDDILLLNDIPFNFNILLRNGDGDIVLPKSIFQELYIEESFDKWGVRGYLVFNNANEQLERYQRSKKVKNSEFFTFRMDGTDEIIIELTPQLKATSSKARTTLNEFPVDILAMSIHVSIYDSEDLTSDLIENKYKKLYFWDYNYNKAIGINQRVSCGEYLAKSGIDVKELNNTDRNVIYGELLKYICEDKLNANVSEDWVPGAMTGFFISDPSTSLFEDIESLRSEIFEDVGYPLWFTYDRTKQEFALKSIKNIFDTYPDTMREIVHFSDGIQPSPSIAPFRHFLDNTWSVTGFSDVLGYKYSKMSPSDNISQFNSRSNNIYDSKSKEFTTTVEEGYIKNSKELCGGLLSNFQPEMQQPLFVINKERLLNTKMISEKNNYVKSNARDTIESYILLNDAIFFTQLGLPNRTPGTFIELDSDNDSQGAWEDRFLGSWFVTKVTHKITVDTYVNQVLAVKPNIPNGMIIPDGSE